MAVTRGRRRLSLLVPGLLDGSWGAREAGLARHGAACINRVLARATSHPFPGGGLEAVLFALFGIEPDPDIDLPVAAVSRVADTGDVDPGWWLRADPVHLRPDQDRVLLFAGPGLGVRAEEARALVQALNEHFADRNLRFEAPVAGRWYLRLSVPPGVCTAPLAAVAGRDIHRHLPAGESARRWRGLLNEVQMLLHGHPVNGDRERAGAPAINGVWFWGGGCIPKPPAPQWACVWAEDSTARGLARLAGTALEAPPPDGQRWLQGAGAGEHLVVLTQVYDPAVSGDWPAWGQAVSWMGQAWFAPLERALRRARLSALDVLPGDGRRYRVTAARLLRFWRRGLG
ncbi:MAG: hypothetical protein GWO16_16145 [Gammaproteobacteria bacterium]|nr:hypothetical protein [Gammaproteobacteria bacterium]